MKYSEKLLDPRWQKRRLQLLEKAEWTCSACGEEKETLHVHHGAYLKGFDPWDYPDEMLHVYCHDCHEFAHEKDAIFMRWYGSLNIQELESLSDNLPAIQRNAFLLEFLPAFNPKNKMIISGDFIKGIICYLIDKMRSQNEVKK